MGSEKLDFIIEFLSKNMFLALILKALLKLEKYFTIIKTLNKEFGILRIATSLFRSLFRIDLKLSMLGICWENNLPALLEIF